MRFVLLLLLAIGLCPGHASAQTSPAMPVYNALTQNDDWLNTSRALTPDDLKGRVILVDFWTYCCINCIHVIPKLQKLEHEFGDKLTVIGVHSAKFTNEGETENIREAIQKYGIVHPVVNDADFRIWNAFGINAWPTLLLIGPDGLLKQVYRGEGDIKEIRRDIKKMIDKTGDTLVTEALPIALEKDKIPPTILRFPSKLAVLGEDKLVVSDSGHHRVLVVDLKTKKIVETIGSGEAGFKDGSFDEAQFNSPQGVLADGHFIFVADTVNHRLRLIDLKSRKVSTLAGTGKRGKIMHFGAHDARSTALASPWDLEFYPDENKIVIANAGTHQLWTYDRMKKKVSLLAGNGRESIDDGKLPLNSLSQPSGLSATEGRLYLADAETSALRVLEKKRLTTLIGTGLFDFGFKDGKQGEALMQHPLGVYADGKTVYIADTYNHALRRYKNGTLSTLGVKGLKEPNDILKIGDVFYVTDTNNHRIQVLGEDGDDKGMLDIMPMEQPIAYQDDLPDVIDLGSFDAASDIAVKIDLPKGWHVNPLAPSWLAVFDTDKKSVAQFKTEDLNDNIAEISGLVSKEIYTLQGTLYYCRDEEGSLCLIRGIIAALRVTDEGDADIPVTLPIKK